MTAIAYFKSQRFQALWLGLVIFGVLAQVFLFNLDLSKQAGIFIFFVLTLGMYHGLLDVILLKEHQQALKKLTYFSPIMLYFSIVVASLCLFKLLPFIPIPILLLITVWHFGEQQGEQQSKYTGCHTQNLITRFILGGASISLPFFLAFTQLDQILQLMLVDRFSYHSAILIWQIISYTWLLTLSCYLVCWLLIALFTVFKFNSGKYTKVETVLKNILNTEQGAELYILLLSFYLLPLLLAFTLYFAAYHSLRHIADIHCEHRIRFFLQPILMVSLASLLLLIAAFYVFPMQQFLTSTILQHLMYILSATIVLITAITIPHAGLISTWRYKLLNSKLVT